MKGLLGLMVLGLLCFLVCVPSAHAEGLQPLETRGIQSLHWNPLAPVARALTAPLYQAAWTLEAMGP